MRPLQPAPPECPIEWRTSEPVRKGCYEQSTKTTSEGTKTKAGSQFFQKAWRYLRKKNETTASNDNMNDPVSSAGTRNSRSFATDVSRTANETARTASLRNKTIKPTRTAAEWSVLAIPHGTKMFPRSVKNRNNLIADAHSIKARYRPEYSRIIAS